MTDDGVLRKPVAEPLTPAGWEALLATGPEAPSDLVLAEPLTRAGWEALLVTWPEAAIEVVLGEQVLYLHRRGRPRRRYRVSTAAAGAGNVDGSECTPTGLHRVAERIGDGLPPGAVLQGRRPTGELADIEQRALSTGQDLICTRILWLEGREVGNSSPGNSSKERYIYIHGTPEEGLIGRPVSHGCIRMRNAEVVELFDLTPAGTPVWITP